MSDSLDVEEQQNIALARRFFDAIEHGDLAEIAGIYHPRAVIWHNDARLQSTREQNLGLLEAFVARSATRSYVDRRCMATPAGFVHQHVLIATRPDGRRLELPACVVCAVEDGQILRLDEYYDPSPLPAWLADDGAAATDQGTG